MGVSTRRRDLLAGALVLGVLALLGTAVLVQRAEAPSAEPPPAPQRVSPARIAAQPMPPAPTAPEVGEDTAEPPSPAPPSAAGRHEILCAVQVSSPRVRGVFTQDLGEHLLSASVQALDGEVVLHAREAEGSGWLQLQDHERVEISWSQGRCEATSIAPPALTAAITGTVRHAADEPQGDVWVSGCGQHYLEPDVDGGFYFLARAGPCTLQAHRKGGMLRAWGEPVEVLAVEGEDVVVSLDLPPWRPAGLGIMIETVDGGIGVMQVIEGTAAWEAGLRDGDVVLEIDGEPTSQMELAAFVERAVGQEGSRAELLVRGDDGTEERMVVERAPVEP